jgi:peptidoglycan hydrolase CwlO-like protein
MSKELSPDTKFTLSIQTMIGAGMGIASLVGMWYMLQADIQEAKELPVPLSLFDEEYPSKAEGYNWSPSYEQYKQQVGNLQENQDDIYDIIEGMQDEIKELNKQITNLRIAVQ